MPAFGEPRFLSVTVVVVLLAAGVILYTNTKWSIEWRSIKELRFLIIDGFIALCFLIGGIAAACYANKVAVQINRSFSIYIYVLLALTAIVFSIAFSFSALQQSRVSGRTIGGITLFLCGLAIPSAWMFIVALLQI